MKPDTLIKCVSRKHLLICGAVLAFTPTLSSAGISMQVGEQGSMDISYAVQIWSQFRDFRSASNSGSAYDTFLRRNRITLFGQYNDLVGYYAQIEAGSDSRFGNDNRSIYYRDAYVTFDHSDAMRFIVGRFKNTFSRENLEACLEPLSIDRAEVIAYTPFAGTRDTGVVMWGNLADAALQYRVMLADGRESDNVAKDSPRITARVHWSLFDPEYDYGYRGTYLGTSRVLTFGLGYDHQPDVAYSDFAAKTGIVDYTGMTADFFYEQPTDMGTFTISGAMFDYDTGNAISNANADPTLPVSSELEASYLKAGYLFPDKIGPGRLQLFARHEISDYKASTNTLDHTLMGFGANYYIDGQKLKVTAEAASVDYDVESTTSAAQQDYNQVTVGLQLIF